MNGSFQTIEEMADNWKKAKEEFQKASTELLVAYEQLEGSGFEFHSPTHMDTHETIEYPFEESMDEAFLHLNLWLGGNWHKDVVIGESGIQEGGL